jgi:hypothetical protein
VRGLRRILQQGEQRLKKRDDDRVAAAAIYGMITERMRVLEEQRAADGAGRDAAGRAETSRQRKLAYTPTTVADAAACACEGDDFCSACGPDCPDSGTLHAPLPNGAADGDDDSCTCRFCSVAELHAVGAEERPDDTDRGDCACLTGASEPCCGCIVSGRIQVRLTAPPMLPLPALAKHQMKSSDAQTNIFLRSAKILKLKARDN